jgi:hypothetical protein
MVLAQFSLIAVLILVLNGSEIFSLACSRPSGILADLATNADSEVISVGITFKRAPEPLKNS